AVISTERKWKCSMCPQAFISPSKLHVHFMGHMERQIKCPKCDKLFLRTNHLKKHLNSHEGKRDYVCEKCTKAYLTKYHLTRHLKICKGPTSSLSAPEEEEEDSEEELIDSMRTEDCRINNGVYSAGDALTGHK
uniref:C2H2-type domain-containing protein n=1 Tax=Anas zonorhyncha TaxID=75864 RepID=A0A8B9ZPJ6_9AVES